MVIRFCGIGDSMMPSLVSCFSRSCPQAAAMSWPFYLRKVAVTPAEVSTSKKASCRCSEGRFQGKPSTVL